eukprot:CCRYP_013961-RA/>CCRYP_013961-RA protein AED:0.47 eAED:0.67 QI:135/0/0.5/1/0/0/2/0/72
MNKIGIRLHLNIHFNHGAYQLRLPESLERRHHADPKQIQYRRAISSDRLASFTSSIGLSTSPAWSRCIRKIQ